MTYGQSHIRMMPEARLRNPVTKNAPKCKCVVILFVEIQDGGIGDHALAQLGNVSAWR